MSTYEDEVGALRAVIDRCEADMRHRDIGEVPDALREQLTAQRHAVLCLTTARNGRPTASRDEAASEADVFFRELQRRLVEAVVPPVPIAFRFGHPLVAVVETYLPEDLVSACAASKVTDATASEVLRRHKKKFQDGEPESLLVRQQLAPERASVEALMAAFDELAPLCCVSTVMVR